MPAMPSTKSLLFIAVAMAWVLLGTGRAHANPGKEAVDGVFLVPQSTHATEFNAYRRACGPLTRWYESDAEVAWKADFDKCTHYNRALQYCLKPLSHPRPSADVVAATASYVNGLVSSDQLTCKPVEQLLTDNLPVSTTASKRGILRAS